MLRHEAVHTHTVEQLVSDAGLDASLASALRAEDVTVELLHAATRRKRADLIAAAPSVGGDGASGEVAVVWEGCAAGASCAAVAAALRASVRLRFTLHAGAELYGFRWRRKPARS